MQAATTRKKFPVLLEGGAAVWGLLSLLILLAGGLGVLLYFFGQVVSPGYFGVRQISLGPGKGYSNRGLSPGYHWSVPFYSKVHVIPQTVMVVQFHRSDDRAVTGALEVQTTDVSKVDVDIAVLARIFRTPCEKGQPCEQSEGVHAGPAQLITNVGIQRESWENQIRRTADDELRRALGKLATGEFYNPFLREKQVEIARDAMTKKLAEYGIGIDSVLLRRYTYRAERIDDAIFDKNLQDQEERLNAMASKLAEAKAALEQVAAESDAKIETLRVEGENKAKVTRSEGSLYETERIAEGDLLVSKVAAEVDRLKAGALAQSVGADVYVARELAPILGSLKGGVVTDLDPFDLDTWMKRLGLLDEGGKQ